MVEHRAQARDRGVPASSDKDAALRTRGTRHGDRAAEQDSPHVTNCNAAVREFDLASRTLNLRQARIHSEIVCGELILARHLGLLRVGQRQVELELQLAPPGRLHRVGGPGNHAPHRGLLDIAQEVSRGTLRLTGDAHLAGIEVGDGDAHA